ncbi:MAG: HAD family hydrolase [Phormidesmis priestleyi]|uniref:HAD family hydrolase n=1 Tax=Phormidesmis priestleyi TaxID=268141 RepID=A0A2W4XA79_9CYAN|nr:MAG: HAD family hydrolase [Phormidesmis priestleyi]
MATVRCPAHTFENIQAVIFDKDGTLANVEAYLIRLGEVRSQLTALQIPAPQAQQDALQSSFLTAFGLKNGAIAPAGLLAVGSRHENEIALAAYIAATGIGWIAALALVQTAFQQADKVLSPKVTQTPLLPGVLSLLQQLEQAGVQSVILSADTHHEVAAFVQHYQLTEISWYRGASANSLPKTHPDALKSACEALNVRPDQTLVIGDSAADLALAHQGSARFLGMTGGWKQPPHISAPANTLDGAPNSASDTSAISAHSDLAVASTSSLRQVECFK